jgi:transglutaminase-like putative cysteine protease
VPLLPEIKAWAAQSVHAQKPVLAAAIELMQRIYADFRYRSLSTSIQTPLAQVFAQREGVCQDFAHILIAAMRAHGLAARYVSGYLLTQPAPGQARLIGADASHAWVQVWCPLLDGGGLWVDLDPTNNLLPSQAHIRLAVGRDFGDVTPIKGVIRGGGNHTVRVAVSVELWHDS